MPWKTITGTGLQTLFPQGGALAPNIDLALKFLVLNFVFHRKGLISIAWMDLPFLPFVSWLDRIPSIAFSLLIVPVFFTAPVAIFFNYRKRLFSLLLGLAMLLLLLAGKPYYSTNLTFHASLFVLIGLAGSKERPFRWQLMIVYAGAGLNKALDPAWWNGEFVNSFTDFFASPGNFLLALVSKHLWLSRLLSWMVVVLEFLVLPTLFSRGATVRPAIMVGWLFHVGLLIITFGQLSIIYLYLVSAGYLIVYPWPESARTSPKPVNWRAYRRELFLSFYFIGLLLWLTWGTFMVLLSKLF